MSFQHSMEKLKLVVLKKFEFENTNLKILNVFGITRPSLIRGKKNNPQKQLSAKITARDFHNLKKSSHQFQNEISVHHGFYVNLSFSEGQKASNF